MASSLYRMLVVVLLVAVTCLSATNADNTTMTTGMMSNMTTGMMSNMTTAMMSNMTTMPMTNTAMTNTTMMNTTMPMTTVSTMSIVATTQSGSANQIVSPLCLLATAVLAITKLS